jgi:hypothetical protein
MAPRVIGAVAFASVFFVAVAGYFFVYGDSYLIRIVGAAVAAFAIAATLDALAAKIVIEADSLAVVSLFRRRLFARSDFRLARVERGAVVMKRADGAWIVLPGTGGNPQEISAALQAWIQAGAPAPAGGSPPAPPA